MDQDPQLLEKERIKMLDDIKRAKAEIQEAVSILVESHGLSLCQVWTHLNVKDANVKYTGGKLDIYCHKDAFKGYYDACVKIEDGSGGLALKALETYQTYFSTNIIKEELRASLPATSASESRCCLAICLRNINTEHIDYAFEFIFSFNDNKDPYVFLDSLFTKLKSCLPSFIFSSGAQLDRQSLVVDGDTLSALETYEKVCKHHQLSRSGLVKYEDAIKRAGVEIQEAVLNTLIDSHGLILCQVWVHSDVKKENEKCAVKLGIGYYIDAFKDYYDACVKIQDGSGGLALKALETYQPYFSKNIVNGKLKALLLPADATSASSKFSYCCVAISLSNIYTGDIDYAFEFFFSLDDKYRNYKNNYTCVFLESLFITLQSCLPSFKFSCGAQLGHQIRAVDADNRNQIFNCFALAHQENDYSKEDVDRRLSGTNFSYNKLRIRGGVYALDPRVYVPATVNFEDLKTKISEWFIQGEWFNQYPNAYRYTLTYSFQGYRRPLWVPLENDRDLKMCIRLCRRKKITQLPIRIVSCPTSSKQGIRKKSRHAILNISRRLIY